MEATVPGVWGAIVNFERVGKKDSGGGAATGECWNGASRQKGHRVDKKRPEGKVAAGECWGLGPCDSNTWAAAVT
eukprot:1158133-Pelagomonas_calceolata.AAC.7